MEIKTHAPIIIGRLRARSKASLLMMALILDLVTGYGDFRFGYEVHLNIFYLLPIFLTIWLIGRSAGIIMTFICAFTMTMAYLIGGEFKIRHWHIIIWNIFLIEVFFLIIALLTIRVKDDMVRRKEMIRELQNALAQVKTLSGLLPICASCKKIRDDSGYWTQVESYISTHSDIAFTHSICPDCAKKLYPEYYDKIFGKEKKENE